MQRCEWVPVDDPLFVAYHDEEWGVPVHDDQTHFEFLILEGAQAGLSWRTILMKRENYRDAFEGFDPVKVAAYDEGKVAELLENPGIVRNRLKVTSAVDNARHFLDVQAEFGSFDKYLWGWVGGQPVVNSFKKMEEIPAKTPLAEDLSKDLKKRGFRFVGPTIIYAHLQAVGVVNDHTVDCFRYAELT
ncbi:MAG: DNA-3-methyladenine glycosylase I [Acidimicrobiia bacterium]